MFFTTRTARASLAVGGSGAAKRRRFAISLPAAFGRAMLHVLIMRKRKGFDMRKNLWMASIVALCVLGTTAHADTPEERLTVATSYIDSTLQDLDMKAVIQGMWKPIAAQLEASGTPLRPEQLQEIDALYQARFTEPMTQIMRDQAKVMAEIYTLDEITALADFYETEHGRAAIVKMPKMMELQTPMIMKMVEDQMPTIMPKIRAIIEGE